MLPLSSLLAALTSTPAGLHATISEDWRQGRTLYGGLSAALCVHAASRALPDRRPLRSAQFSFTGPATGMVTVQATLLRQGKSAAFAAATLIGEDGPATQALLCFSAPRKSVLSHRSLPPPPVSPADACPDFFDRKRAPAFVQHFDMRQAGGASLVSGATEPELLVWVRHRDTALTLDDAALVALADAAPPAAMTLFMAPAPISTVTWSLDVLAALPPAYAPRWLLLRSKALTAADGYSTQIMAVWDDEGNPVMTGTQCVAVFT